MKKAIFTLLSCLILYSAKAQLTLLNTIPANASPACINSTWKYVYVTNSCDSIVYINNDGSAYKVINVTWPSYVTKSRKIQGVYQNFITTDGQVSYISEGNDSLYGGDYTFIYKEDGTQLLAVSNVDVSVTTIVSATDEAWGIEVYSYNGDTSFFYSVPGTYCLSCTPAPCSAAEGIAEPAPVGKGNLQVYPNPSSREATVNYHLPPGANAGDISVYSLAGQLLRKVHVTNATGTFLDSAVEPGTYFYKLSTIYGNVLRKQVFMGDEK